jgi:2-dehydropantoate 2-reductase
MKLLVLGAGGIGGYFGGRIAESGADVTFFVRPKRREQIAKDGLVIESPNGNAKLQVKTVVAGELEADYGAVLFTCKAYDLDSAMDAIAPAMQGSCAVVPMLNGISHLERLDARFGAANVLGGTCQINVKLSPEGVVQHMEPLNRMIFGARDASQQAKAQAFAGVLAATSIKWTPSDVIMQDLWEKMTFLSTLAACTCLFRANIGEIMAAPDGKAIVERCLDSAIAVATRAGYPPRMQLFGWARERLTQPGGAQSASMLRDLEAGGPTEADHIVGFMLAKAREYDIDDTVFALAYTHLRAYDAKRAAGRLS